MSDARRAQETVARRALATASMPVVDASGLQERARLTVTFHPDRPARDGRTTARALADDGTYRTQFETGTSSGGLDQALAGARSRWEHEMFGGAYDGAPPAARPRYGGLDLLPYPDGACPRFGSTHLVLRREVLARCTFSWGDSVTEPTAVGTWDRLGAVLDAAAAESAPELRGEPRDRADRLDGYIEAQIHGGLHMTDVEAVVSDPAYRGTAVERDLARACDRFDARLQWHAGYRLPISELDPAFRGPEPVALAHRIGDRCGRDTLDPELLGRAALSLAGDASLLQQLKYLWHHLAAFGYGPRSASGTTAMPSARL